MSMFRFTSMYTCVYIYISNVYIFTYYIRKYYVCIYIIYIYDIYDFILLFTYTCVIRIHTQVGYI